MASALITGGSSGIGLAIARMLRDEGFALTLASRTAEKVEAAAAELGAHAIAADVSKPEDCARVVEEHVAREGGLDVLVNSAGIGIAGRVEDVQLKHLDRQLAINLRGLVLVTQAAIPHLRKTKGWIVNLASIAGTQPVPILPIYAASKAAVISLTHSLNADLDDDGVRAIAICPGFVDTPMADFSGLPGEEMIQPEDCAEVVRMCLRLSPRARDPAGRDRARRLERQDRLIEPRPPVNRADGVRTLGGRDDWIAVIGQGSAFDRDVDEVAPLGPRAVVVLDVGVAEQLAEDEPGVRAALADAAVGEHLLLGRDALRAVELAQLVGRLERAVVADRLRPRDRLRARDVAACATRPPARTRAARSARRCTPAGCERPRARDRRRSEARSTSSRRTRIDSSASCAV